jgi:hypothetical protein
MSIKIETLRSLLRADEIVGNTKKASAKTKNLLYKQVCAYATTLYKSGFDDIRLDRVVKSTIKNASGFAYHKGKVIGIIYGA